MGAEEEEEKSKKVVEALHKILRPFLLRRVKNDVEDNLLPSMCPFPLKAVFALMDWTENEISIYVWLTEMQRKWYQSILEKSIDAVNGKCDWYMLVHVHRSESNLFIHIDLFNGGVCLIADIVSDDTF